MYMSLSTIHKLNEIFFKACGIGCYKRLQMRYSRRNIRKGNLIMNFLEERILQDGIVKEGNVLKVDSFLNHQMDIKLFEQMGAEWKKRFADKPINKIVTIEASGIGIACIAAEQFGVPVVFAKKHQSVNIDGDMYVAEVESFTHKCQNKVIVSKKFLGPDDHVLLIDDFLANGCALQGLISIVHQAGGTVEGIGIAIEKGFQTGGRVIRNLGYQLESLAIVDAMDAATGHITFREQ
jgi:xanthine phosphoribosyltransferase